MNRLPLVIGGASLVYLTLAWMMGVLPGIELSRVPPGPGVHPLTPLQAEGRDVYVSSGCGYCHTQQVRPLNQDKVFGRPSTAGDFSYETPELLGSERTGPDLTNVGVRQPSSVWNYIHLYNPRAVVPESIMPSFSWLFDVVDTSKAASDVVPLPKAYAPTHGVVIPKHEAQALIAYLASLKQALLPADLAGSGNAEAAVVNSSTAAVPPTAPAPASAAATPSAGDIIPAKGASLFTANCAACHQANGEGLPGAFPSLKNNEGVNDEDPTMHIHVVLQGLHDAKVNGVAYGSAMPPFGPTLSDVDIANIIDYERASWGNHGKAISTAQVTQERAKAK
jgi:cytochrome c oxidase cbb3-type subunit 2